MKKVLMMVTVAMMTAMSMSLTSCAEQEEGESNEDWILRNVINGAAWHVDMIQNSDGSWVRWEDAALFNFNVKFSASKHNFKAEKFYYKDGVADESTREKYDENDNTLYAIKDAKIIEGMVDGKNFFRITLHKEVSSVMECSLYFYKENKTYEVKMTR
jgi:hypothetical protein